jgi:opacity protein-like surface antigen
MKPLFIFLFSFLTLGMYAQAGDLFVAPEGGFVTHYKNGMYGLNVSYHLNDGIELSFTGLLNTNIPLEAEFNKSSVEDLSIYSLNLDIRYYLLLMRSWAMGPALGYQYQAVKNKTNSLGDLSASGFNIGWHTRFNITDEIKIMGGWRYTSTNEELRHHYIYIGIGYTFSLF